MCRNIKTLFNFDPPATHEEIHDASLQYIKKISGFTKPSQVNNDAYNIAVEEIEKASQKLLLSLSTEALPKNREVEKLKLKQRSAKRFAAN